VAPLNEQVSEHATATPPPYVTSPGPQWVIQEEEDDSSSEEPVEHQWQNEQMEWIDKRRKKNRWMTG
jgi:hypothetical protein